MKKKKKNYFLKLADKYRDLEGEAPCPHFDKCGGCMFQDISYENQLLLKKEYLNELLDGIVSIDAVNGADPFNYRNRMDMVSAFEKFGLRERGSFKFVVDIETCLIMQKKSRAVYEKMHPFVKEIEGYNYLNHTGYLRYAVLRQGFFTEEVMVNFVVAQKDRRLDSVIEAIEGDVDSISIIFNDGLADTSFGEIAEVVKGGYIRESFEDIEYRITPNSFFQSNSDIALQMYRRIRDHAEGSVLDLYSGIGSISLFLAKGVESVTGVEMVEEAVESANENKEINGIENASFVCMDARPYIREHAGEYKTLVLDPPRSGMHPKMLKHIPSLKADKIIYMSCNPASFKNDILMLEDYELQSFEAFDMFPQTPHVETLVVLQKI